jgi:NAD(P)-dependent dehydrogenase (short-subunit alcohol dehydrogenase family)
VVGILDLFRLDGKRALVTGGSRGLGRSMALALADVGADIIITGRNQDTLDATAGEIRALGRKAWTIAADMGAPPECEKACARAIDEMGPIDILINNVGNREENVSIENESLETWQRLVDLNLTSCFIGTKLVGKAMLDRGKGGRIINIASISAIIANRGIAGRHYETAKAAVLHFSRCAAADWAPHGITVNAICPGLFMTDANKQWNKTRPDVIQAIVDNIPMGRTGEPEEIGPLAVYLASPAAAYVTGAAYVIDGGYTLW